MYVCMRACMHACMPARMHVCLQLHTTLHMYICICYMCVDLKYDLEQAKILRSRALFLAPADQIQRFAGKC